MVSSADLADRAKNAVQSTLVPRPTLDAVSSLLALALTLGVAPARASDPTDEARAAYDEGARAYDAHDYPSAARSFAHADERVPTARALGLAMAAALLANDAPLAMELVARARRRAVDGSLAALADKLDQRFAGEVGSVRLECPKALACRGTLEGAPIRVGTPRFATPGAHRAELTTENGNVASLTLEVVAGREVVLSLPVGALPSTSARSVTSTPTPSNPPRGLSPVLFITSASLGVVAAATSIGLTVMTADKHEAFVKSPSRATSDAGSGAQTAARLGWGLTGAFAVTSALLAIWTEFGGPKESKVSLGFGPGALSVAGTF